MITAGKYDFAKRVALTMIGLILSGAITATSFATKWTVGKIGEMDDRILMLETMVPTNEDFKDIQKDISLIRESLAVMDERNRQSDSRDLDDKAEIKDRLDDMVTLLNNVNNRLIRLETVMEESRRDP